MSGVVLTDGGMGQELLRRSGAEPTPLWSAQVMMDRPELVTALHADFIAAGARVITINAYSATPERLARDGLGDMFAPLQARAIDAAKAARDASGRDIAIAGCLPPLYGSYQPHLRTSFDETLAIYRRIVAEQADEVDLILCETMASAEEGRAAALAATECGKPVWVSWTLSDDDPPKLRGGDTIDEASAALSDLLVSARLVNCSRPETIDSAMPELVALGGPVGAYANGFSAVGPLKIGGTVKVLDARADLGPEAYADYALGWVELGAAIVGGCCEVGPAHIAAIARRLEEADIEIIGVSHA